MASDQTPKNLTIVVKLGSSSIVHEKTHQTLLSKLSSVAETVVHLRMQGHKVVLVSSGAIAVGLKRMDMESKPKCLSGKQALAAIGQGRLIALWDNLFGQLGQPIAQVLLTKGDISERTRYLNAVNTFKELLSMGVVPIVNENDTVSVSEIKFGDNDTLSAITSSMLHADFLFLLTDVDGLYSSNPRKDPSAKLLEVVDSVSSIRSKINITTVGSSLGTGGMETKLVAADIATAAGVTTVIMSSNTPENIRAVIQYHNRNFTAESRLCESSSHPEPQTGAVTETPFTRPPHTVFTASLTPIRDLKSWTLHTLFPAGSVIIDAGAHLVLSRRESGGRLLAAGVVGVIGVFASGQAVRIVVHKQLNGLTGGEADAHEKAAEYIRGMETPNRPTTPTSCSAAPLSRSGSFQALNEVGSKEVEKGSIFSESDVIEVGRGLANYNSDQIVRVKGLKSFNLPHVLGYADSEYVVENITIRIPPV